MDQNAIKPAVIYIIDDDESVLKALARLMRVAGYSPTIYQTPALFLESVHDEMPACILLDMTMPEMTGHQVLAALNARGITIPVIAVSAWDDEKTRQHARELGARSFLQKPVEDQALLDAIAWALQSLLKAPARKTFANASHTDLGL